GIHDDEEYSSSFDLLNVAREVAFECEGLPRTIKDVVIFIKLYLKGDSRPSWMMEDCKLETKFPPLF
ncbi:TIR-similar-domain-containing protein TSDC, partial [Trifolium pratense]